MSRNFFISIFNKPMGPMAYSLTVLAGILMLAITTVLFSLYVDPYWLFREKPLWEHSPALDQKQHFVKPLQIMLHPPSLVWIGSSRVYRGINPASYPNDWAHFYNAGVSSLNISGAYELVKLAVRTEKTQKIVVGLDFWMFESNEKPLFHTNLGSLINDLLTATFSKDAIKDAGSALKAKPSSDGQWFMNGFHQTLGRSGAQIAEMKQAYVSYISKQYIDFNKLKILEAMIVMCARYNKRLVLYISPLHQGTYQHYNAQTFQQWLERLHALVKRYHVPLLDYSKQYLNRSPSLQQGSTKDWLDYSHFSPKVGEIIQRDVARVIGP